MTENSGPNDPRIRRVMGHSVTLFSSYHIDILFPPPHRSVFTMPPRVPKLPKAPKPPKTPKPPKAPKVAKVPKPKGSKKKKPTAEESRSPAANAFVHRASRRTEAAVERGLVLARRADSLDERVPRGVGRTSGRKKTSCNSPSELQDGCGAIADEQEKDDEKAAQDMADSLKPTLEAGADIKESDCYMGVSKFPMALHAAGFTEMGVIETLKTDRPEERATLATVLAMGGKDGRGFQRNRFDHSVRIGVDPSQLKEGCFEPSTITPNAPVLAFNCPNPTLVWIDGKNRRIAIEGFFSKMTAECKAIHAKAEGLRTDTEIRTLADSYKEIMERSLWLAAIYDITKLRLPEYKSTLLALSANLDKSGTPDKPEHTLNRLYSDLRDQNYEFSADFQTTTAGLLHADELLDKHQDIINLNAHLHAFPHFDESPVKVADLMYDQIVRPGIVLYENLLVTNGVVDDALAREIIEASDAAYTATIHPEIKHFAVPGSELGRKAMVAYQERMVHTLNARLKAKLSAEKPKPGESSDMVAARDARKVAHETWTGLLIAAVRNDRIGSAHGCRSNGYLVFSWPGRREQFRGSKLKEGIIKSPSTVFWENLEHFEGYRTDPNWSERLTPLVPDPADVSSIRWSDAVFRITDEIIVWVFANRNNALIPMNGHYQRVMAEKPKLQLDAALSKDEIKTEGYSTRSKLKLDEWRAEALALQKRQQLPFQKRQLQTHPVANWSAGMTDESPLHIRMIRDVITVRGYFSRPSSALMSRDMLLPADGASTTIGKKLLTLIPVELTIRDVHIIPLLLAEQAAGLTFDALQKILAADPDFQHYPHWIAFDYDAVKHLYPSEVAKEERETEENEENADTGEGFVRWTSNDDAAVEEIVALEAYAKEMRKLHGGFRQLYNVIANTTDLTVELDDEIFIDPVIADATHQYFDFLQEHMKKGATPCDYWGEPRVLTIPGVEKQWPTLAIATEEEARANRKAVKDKKAAERAKEAGGDQEMTNDDDDAPNGPPFPMLSQHRPVPNPDGTNNPADVPPQAADTANVGPTQPEQGLNPSGAGLDGLDGGETTSSAVPKADADVDMEQVGSTDEQDGVGSTDEQEPSRSRSRRQEQEQRVSDQDDDDDEEERRKRLVRRRSETPEQEAVASTSKRVRVNLDESEEDEDADDEAMPAPAPAQHRRYPSRTRGVSTLRS
ncbi:hypothetical protein C8F01DRAFT_1092966 [Mycena amicta]|nr:hypothetical protein C8F01DRAFT_1092966 [Mycena amicta]